MSDDGATTQVLIYRIDPEAVTAIGQGSLIDPQVVVLHDDAVEQLADQLAAAAATAGPTPQLRVEVISAGTVLVCDGTLGTSVSEFGPAIAAVGLNVPSAAPVDEVAGLAPWDVFVLPPDPGEPDYPFGRPLEVDVDAIATSIRELVARASAAELPLADNHPGVDDPALLHPITPADRVGPVSIPVTDEPVASAVLLAHRTVSPLCRLFPWLPFC